MSRRASGSSSTTNTGRPRRTAGAVNRSAAAAELPSSAEAASSGEPAVAVAASWRADAPPLLVGVNVRDLATLRIRPDRLAELSTGLPATVPAVAESGIDSADDVRGARALGYTVALVGSALMRSDDPSARVAALLAAGRS
jgi:hypothetical protein